MEMSNYSPENHTRGGGSFGLHQVELSSLFSLFSSCKNSLQPLISVLCLCQRKTKLLSLIPLPTNVPNSCFNASLSPPLFLMLFLPFQALSLGSLFLKSQMATFPFFFALFLLQNSQFFLSICYIPSQPLTFILMPFYRASKSLSRGLYGHGTDMGNSMGD